MPSYLWTGKDNAGKEQVERVEADSAEAARDMLLRRGWTELRVHTHDITEFINRQHFNPALRRLAPKQELAFHQGKQSGFFACWAKDLWNSCIKYPVMVPVSVGIFAWALYRGNFPLKIIFGALLLPLLFMYPVLRFWFGRSSDLFKKLHTARNWRRWREVFLYMDSLERVGTATGINISKSELARYWALALAGTGKLNEALQRFDRAAETAQMPAWMKGVHRASIYVVAGDYDGALTSYRQALESGEQKGLVSLDFAALLVTRFKEPAQARELLSQVDLSTLPPTAGAAFRGTSGLIAYYEGNLAEANRLLSEALATFGELGKTRWHVYEPNILMTNGFLGVANAAQGNKEAARKHFGRGERYLKAIKMDHWIAEYRRLMAL